MPTRSAIAALLLAATALGDRATGATIQLLDSASPDGAIVRLRDVARIDSADASERARLSAVPIMPTPPPGTRQFVSAGSIRELLTAQGESASRHRFGGAYRVLIETPVERAQLTSEQDAAGWGPARRRASAGGFGFRAPAGSQATQRATLAPRQRVPSRREEQQLEQTVADRVQSALDARLRTAPDAKPLLVRGVQLSQTALRELLLMQDRGLEVRLPSGRSIDAGSVSVEVWPSSRDESDAFRAVAELIEPTYRVVAAAPMQRGSLVTASAVRREMIPVDQLEQTVASRYSELDEAIGKEATRSIRAGDLLSDANTAPPLMVRRGDQVTVTSGGGGISVSLQATARTDGREGDLVQVEAYDRREKFNARVVGPRRLAILSAGTASGSLARTGGLQ